MSSYADISDLKNSISIAGADTFLDQDLDHEITVASNGLNRELGRNFDKTEDATVVRLYEAKRSHWTREVEIDDLIDLTSVRTKASPTDDWEAWTLDTDFRLEPLNAATDGEPWTLLRSLGTTMHWPSNALGVIEVTGQFGWAEVPEEIVSAATLIAEKLLIRKRQAPLGFVTSGSEVGAVAYIARNDPQVAGLIEPFYRRKRRGSVQLS